MNNNNKQRNDKENDNLGYMMLSSRIFPKGNKLANFCFQYLIVDISPETGASMFL